MGRHPLTSTSDPKHWLDRAEEMRAIADSLTGEERRRADARPRGGLRDAGSARSRTHAARHDKIGPRARGFCRCEFGVVHSGRERTYQDDRLELAPPEASAKTDVARENPVSPIAQKPSEPSIALLLPLYGLPPSTWSMGE